MFLYNQTADRTRVFYVFIVISAMMVVFPPSKAIAQSDPFTVEDVEVDITADNAVQAREQAFEAAQIKAYEKLAENLLDEAEFELFETPDLNSISSLVKDFEVTNEKLSAVRYNGTYTIRFREHNLGSYSAQNSANLIDEPGNKVSGETLILPVIVKDGRNYLWSNSVYADQWAAAINSDMSARYIIPLGDVQDRTAIRDDEILTYDYSRVARIMNRYGANKAVIVITNPQLTSQSNAVTDLSIYNVTRDGPELIKNTQIPNYPGELPEQLFPRVISQSKIIINNAVAQMVAEEPAVTPFPITDVMGSNKLLAQVEFNSVRDWIDIKKSLERTPSIKEVYVQSMSAREATIEIAYNGSPQSLSEDLVRARMQLGTSYSNAYGQRNLYKIQRIR